MTLFRTNVFAFHLCCIQTNYETQVMLHSKKLSGHLYLAYMLKLHS
jgi:hypothetical protein